MGVVIISTLQRGAAGTAPFPISKQDDLQIPHVIVPDIATRDAIPEWKRISFMTCYVIDQDTTFKLGVDVTIVGQVWTDQGSGSQFQLLSEKNQASGYVGLNAEGFIDPQYIRSISVQDYYVVNNEAERLALVALTGDIAHQLDNNNIYIKKNNKTPPTLNSDWADITPSATVSSVNGQVGAVSITINGLLGWLSNQAEFDAAVGATPAILSLNGQVAVNTADIAAIFALLSGITGEADSLPVWDNGTAYVEGNVVLHDPGVGRKNLYRCTIAPAIGVDPTNIAFWELIGDFYTQQEIDDMMALKADLVGGQVPIGQLPVDEINKYYLVADLAARNALQPSLTADDRVVVMEALSAEVPQGGIAEYVYKPGDPNADGLGFVFFSAASSDAFDWNRPVKKVPVLGVNIGKDNIADGLEEMFFGPIYPTITYNNIAPAEVGSSSSAQIEANVVPNDVDTVDAIRIIRQSDDAVLDTPTPETPPTATPISYAAPAVTMLDGATESYRIEVDYTVGGNSGTVISEIKAFTGLYPMLAGNGATGLTGGQIYGLNKIITPQQNTYFDAFIGSERLYFAIPDTMDALVSAIDQHQDELFGSYFSITPVVVSVPSSGLAADWTIDYKVYESQYDAITNNERLGFLFEFESEEGLGSTSGFTPSDKAKLDSIETGAEVNPSAAEIKTLYESNADTNAYDDGAVAKLGGIEAGAEVNQDDAEIKVQYENNPDTNAFNDFYKALLDGLPPLGDMQKSVYDADDNGIVDRAENQEITVLNAAGVILSKGTVVFVSGYSEGQELLTVIRADRTLGIPANGIIAEEIAVAGSGRMIIQGTLTDMDTDGLALDTILYLDTAGTYTEVRPTEGIIQPVALVAHASATLGILYIGLGSVFQPTLELWRANTPYVEGNLIAADDPYDPLANKKFYRALRSFTSQATFDPQRVDFNLDWELIGGDMSKSTYDVDNRGFVDQADTSVVEVINNTGGTLNAGDLVNVSGYHSVSGKSEVQLADQSTLIKAQGMLIQSLNDTDEGLMVVSGVVLNQNTLGLAVNDPLYLSTAGGWTITKPTSGIIQLIGYVIRVDSSLGRIKMQLEDQEIETQESLMRGHFSVTGGTSNKISHGPMLLIELDQEVTYTVPEISTLTDTDYRIDLKNISGGNVIVQASGSDTIEGDTQVELINGENMTLYMKPTEYKIL